MPSAGQRLRSWLLIISIAAGFGSCSNSLGAQALSQNSHIESGDRLAHNLCINCHVVDKRSPVLRTDRVPSFAWIANEDGQTATSITVWLSISHERMPNFTLRDDQINDLAAYIMTLRTGRMDLCSAPDGRSTSDGPGQIGGLQSELNSGRTCNQTGRGR